MGTITILLSIATSELDVSYFLNTTILLCCHSNILFLSVALN
jgi:hypothetical protein